MKGTNESKSRRRWLIFAILLIILEIAAVAAAGMQIVWLNMIPTRYLLIAAGAVLLLVIITIIFLLIKGNSVALRRVRQIIGSILSVIIIASSISGAVFVGKINHTVSSITMETTTSNVVGVYVMKSNAAQSIVDIKDYKFAITPQFDYENTTLALGDINKVLSTSVATIAYDNVTDMVDALFKEEVDAIILNEAYSHILAEQEKYFMFADDTRIVYEYKVLEERPQKEDTKKDNKEKSLAEEPFIAYVSGSDTLTSTLQTSRSDVNILAVVNPTTKQILLLNTPRDTYVGTTKSKNLEKDKLTHCGLYGIDCSISTLEKFYDIEVDCYAQINFTGFKTLIDDIGGVTVYCEKAFTSADGFKYKKGENTLNGEYALSFVRERDAFGDGDHQRGRDQMKVIIAILEKARNSTALLENYSDILDDLSGMFVTDMSSSDMSALVKMQLDDMAEWNIKTYGLIGEGKSKTTYSVPNQKAYVMIPDEDSIDFARELIQMVYDGEEITDEVLEQAPVDRW